MHFGNLQQQPSEAQVGSFCFVLFFHLCFELQEFLSSALNCVLSLSASAVKYPVEAEASQQINTVGF